jgi:hypothetical protein
MNYAEKLRSIGDRLANEKELLPSDLPFIYGLAEKLERLDYNANLASMSEAEDSMAVHEFFWGD